MKNVRTENKGQCVAPTANATVSPTKQPENVGGQTVSPTVQVASTPTVKPTAEPTETKRQQSATKKKN